MAARFDPDVFQRLAEIEEVDVELTVEYPGALRRTTIWIVTVGPDVYIRSVNGEAGRWYRGVRAHPDIILHASGLRLPVRAVLVSDPAIIQRVSEAYLTKYADSEWAPPMAEPHTLPTTLRLEPLPAAS